MHPSIAPRLRPAWILALLAACAFTAVAASAFTAQASGTPAAPLPDGANLALNRPVTASSTESTGYPAGAAVDGNTATRWSSEFSDPQWIYVDLGQTYDITRVRLVWEAAYAKTFRVQVSNDAVDWTTVYGTRRGAGGVDDLMLSGSGRYVRVFGSVRATTYGYSLWEFEVYSGTPDPTPTAPAPTPTGVLPTATGTGVPPTATGIPLTATGTSAPPTATGISPTATATSVPPTATPPSGNMALNRPAVASSSESTALGAASAVDGSSGTRWSSQFSDPQWIYVDLGQTYNFTRVRLNWEAAYARAYQIQVSGNAATWTTVYSTSTGDGGVDDLAVTGSARYVRVYGTARATTYGYSLWDLEVYANGTPAPTPTPPAVTPTATPPAGWRLIWNDEFDGVNGTAPDSARWGYHTGCTGWGNNELQNYTNRLQNAALDQGDLVLTALRETLGGCAYTSAKLVTQYHGDWLYGRVDVRARLPYGQGLWPAIWLMPTDSVYGIWPNSGEIDIMENLGNDTNVVHGTAHWADATGTHLQSGASYRLPNNGSFAEGYHVFSLEWEPGVLRWYVDGNPYHTVYQGAPFDQRFFLILNVAVGGNWPGPPDGTTTFPQTMRVDYVRVYQR